MYQLKIYGLGGQGVVTASEILVHAAALHEHRYARSLPAYGHERRGALVFADVMLDTEPILLSSFVYKPDYVLLFDPSVADKGVDIGQGVSTDTVLVLNTGDSAVLARFREGLPWKTIYHVDATRIALNTIGSNIPNSAMLGACAKTGIVRLESVCHSLAEAFGRERSEDNVRAAKEAYHQTRKL